MRGKDAFRSWIVAAAAAYSAAGCTVLSTHDFADSGNGVETPDLGTAAVASGSPSIRRVSDQSSEAIPVTDEDSTSGRILLTSAEHSDEPRRPLAPSTTHSARPPRTISLVDDSTERRALDNSSEMTDSAADPQPPRPELRQNTPPTQGLALEEVLTSVRATYPLLASAFESRRIAEGEQKESWGEFDFKLKSTLIRQPQGYYENYRRSIGFEQPTYFGGQVFGSYRLVRGDVEPWYQERVTNRGGEFAGGFLFPLLQGRRIDPRRADLWKATYERTLTEYEIQEQGIDFLLNASIAYWDWVAAGELLRLTNELLKLADARVDFLQNQIDLERQPSIALVDNQRMIVSRQAKQIEAQQKLQQSAVKLSLFLRTPAGEPIVPSADMLPPLPRPQPIDLVAAEAEISVALRNRPELRQLIVRRKQLEVDRALAKNMTEPSVNAGVYWTKDVGEQANPYKKIDDKEPLTTEASVLVDVPLQRRKARGKMMAVEGKLSQNAAKRSYTENKITSEVQSVIVAIDAAYQTYQRAVEAVRLNEEMEQAERVKLELQRSDLLLLNLREQATFDAHVTEIAARLQYHQAQALRRAVLGVDASSFANPDCVPTREEY